MKERKCPFVAVRVGNVRLKLNDARVPCYPASRLQPVFWLRCWISTDRSSFDPHQPKCDRTRVRTESTLLFPITCTYGERALFFSLTCVGLPCAYRRTLVITKNNARSDFIGYHS